jgi:Restriction endonuclease
MEKLLELTMKMDNERQDIFNRTMEENRKGLERLQIEKRGLEEKLKQYRQLVDIRESEVKLHEYNVHSLENEVKMLHELLKKDYLTESKSDTAEDMKKKLEIEQAKFNEPALALNDNLINLQDTVRGLEEVQEKKGDLLKEMNNILKAMLKGGKRDQMTQVEEGELAWIAKNIYREEHKQPKQRDIETIKTSAINLEEYVQQEVDQKGIIPGVDPLQIIALYDKIENIEEPLDPIQQSPAKTGGKQVMSLENAQNIAQTISDNWNLPLTMIVFLENVTKGKEMANVLPWPFFKKQIYEIYVDRLNNSFELSNSLIATWVPMSEYLCLYFLKVNNALVLNNLLDISA